MQGESFITVLKTGRQWNVLGLQGAQVTRHSFKDGTFGACKVSCRHSFKDGMFGACKVSRRHSFKDGAFWALL